ncbi:hypothetical protein AJ88_29155 [Mesorhizobium amorphae CCBAU 01583]|nr:hypothetical protein AJ88_29155 [Mesorhizobium amorphae CCBAU 01583]
MSFALGGAAVAGLLMLHMAFGSGWTTVLIGAAAIVPALATRWRSYPVLGWISVAAVIAVLSRVAYDPTIVGAGLLSTTPVFTGCCLDMACRRWPSASPPGNWPAPPMAGRGSPWKQRRRCLRCLRSPCWCATPCMAASSTRVR